MNKQRNLLYGQALFAILIIVAFGLIIINEKKTIILLPKIQKKIDIYIDENYNNLNNINKSKIRWKDNKYILKVTSKENKNLYFYITYNNDKITDTYKKDYLEGNTLINKIKKDLEKDILNNLKIKTNVEIDTKLNDFTDQIKEKIINEDIKKIKIYYIETNINIDKWNNESITQDINSIINKIYSKDYNPKYINVTITNNNDITESYKINNLNKDFINNKSNIQIISDIINEKETSLLKENKITYKKLN